MEAAYEKNNRKIDSGTDLYFHPVLSPEIRMDATVQFENVRVAATWNRDSVPALHRQKKSVGGMAEHYRKECTDGGVSGSLHVALCQYEQQ